MASELTDGLTDALAEAIEAYDQSFTWEGNTYGCVLDVSTSTLVTSKALFSGNGYPEVGDVIKVLGKSYPVQSVANAGMELVPGGLVQTQGPFVDDPTNPALAIVFDTFINK